MADRKSQKQEKIGGTARTYGELALMARIHDRWHGEIVNACAGTRIPVALVAAFIANESGGTAAATNLEHGILAIFDNILNNRPVKWRPLRKWELQALSEQQVRDYATSFGLTQITGYHVYPRDPHVLLDPATSLRETVVMLHMWEMRYRLDPRTQAEEFFHCWNAGGPHGRTAVPSYVPDGLRHMKAYQEIETPDDPQTEGAQAPALPRQVAPSAPRKAGSGK